MSRSALLLCQQDHAANWLMLYFQLGTTAVPLHLVAAQEMSAASLVAHSPVADVQLATGMDTR